MADIQENYDMLQIPKQEFDAQDESDRADQEARHEGLKGADGRVAVMEINGMRIYEAVEHRVILYADDLIDIDTYLDFSYATGRDLELLDGVMMDRATARGATLLTPLNNGEIFEPGSSELARMEGQHFGGQSGGKPEPMAAQLTHEKLFAWLMVITSGYAEQGGLGLVLGSRSPVQFEGYRGRMPDLLFVRQERISIVQERTISGPPDLVVELVSPNDRPGELRALQGDYRAMGVGEIVLIDMPRQEVRVTRLEGAQYIEEILVTGEWRCRALPGLNLQVEWLLREPRPQMLTTLQTLLDNAPPAPQNEEQAST